MVTSLGLPGISQSTTAAWPLTDDVPQYRKAGFEAIGIWLQKLAEGRLATLRLPPPLPSADVVHQAQETLEAAGLPVSHIIGSGFYTDPDPMTRARNVAHTIAAIGIAESLGARCLVVVPGALHGQSRQRALDLSAAAIAEALERTEGTPVNIALEPVLDVDFIWSLDEALDLIELVDHERLCVLPDSFHVLRDPAGLEALDRAEGRIDGVHIADATVDNEGNWSRLPPGEGELDLASFVAAVNTVGYTGTYDVELISTAVSQVETNDLLYRCAAGMRELLGGLQRHE